MDIGAFEFERSPNSLTSPDNKRAWNGFHATGPCVSSFKRARRVTADANEDYALAEWSGDATGQDKIVIRRMDRDKSIVANFRYAPAP